VGVDFGGSGFDLVGKSTEFGAAGYRGNHFQ
jgi:hypothetical protein